MQVVPAADLRIAVTEDAPPRWGRNALPPAFHRGGDAQKVELWAGSKLAEALGVVARRGGTGLIEAAREDNTMWRWRLADGVAYDEDARIVYRGEVDTQAWIAQLQSSDEHDLDRAAIVASEADATTLIVL